ncbi:hypothetical protein CYQ88_09155 [Hydrogenovibrio sp. SC-1]|nr:hypothetical protein CYQ88_09155 [Hydrogenovibrio sp. SC-1]
MVLNVLLIVSVKSFAFTQSCQLVAKMAGDAYEARPDWFASLSSPSLLNGQLGSLVERNGAWYIYKTSAVSFKQEQCTTQKLVVNGHSVEIVPVLYNRKTHQSAVINGRFLIKVYRVKNLSQLVGRYGFKKVSVLPNRFTAIFDVRPQKSYDYLIERLDQDRDVEWVAPILSEPN